MRRQLFFSANQAFIQVTFPQPEAYSGIRANISCSLHRVAFTHKAPVSCTLRARRARPCRPSVTLHMALSTHASSPVYKPSFGSETHSIRPPTTCSSKLLSSARVCLFLVLFLGCEVRVNLLMSSRRVCVCEAGCGCSQTMQFVAVFAAGTAFGKQHCAIYRTFDLCVHQLHHHAEPYRRVTRTEDCCASHSPCSIHERSRVSR